MPVLAYTGLVAVSVPAGSPISAFTNGIALAANYTNGILSAVLHSLFGKYVMKKAKALQSLRLQGFRFFSWCSSGDSNPGHPA